MKFLKLPNTVKHYILCSLLFGTSSGILAQIDVQTKLSKFLILVETPGDEIKLTCNDGCAWKQLSFSSSIKSNPQAVDQYGMTMFPRNEIKQDSLLSNFLFTIKRTQEGVSLEGKEGTAWTKLSFGCLGGKCFQQINEYGMTDNDKK